MIRCCFYLDGDEGDDEDEGDKDVRRKAGTGLGKLLNSAFTEWLTRMGGVREPPLTSALTVTVEASSNDEFVMVASSSSSFERLFPVCSS